MRAVWSSCSGPTPTSVVPSLAAARRLADRRALDPRADLGIGEVHFPELLVEAGEPAAVLRQRCEAGLGRRGMTLTAQVQQRLDDELSVIGSLGYPTYFLTIA